MKKRRLVVVGNGMAGMRTVEELLRLAPDLYDITVFGAEPHPNYNRILLSPVLTGEQTLRDIVLNDLDWYAKNGIALHLGRSITQINRSRREVIADDGSVTPYDRLLLATGSSPFVLPVPGKDLDGVITFRDIRDVNLMIEAAGRLKRAVVIGGGLLGLEAANGLASRGMDVSVVHLGEALLDRQLDGTAASLLQKSLRDRGLNFLMGRETDAILDNGHGAVGGIRFKDGTEIETDLVVMAVGIRPNTGLARAAGIHTERGIVVNDTMQTFDPAIYAVGECVSHRGIAYGLVAPLFEQAKVAANHLAMFGIGRYAGSATSTKLKVTGIDLFSAGDFLGGPHTEVITLADYLGGVYKKLVIQDGKLVGACLYGDTLDGAWYLRLIREGTPIAALREQLMFGEDAGGQAGQDRAPALALQE
jgi:nitrite reductase (NADH) large subunit